MAATLWYFAYGANMARAVLVRRVVQPARSQAATLPGYALRFNHPGLPPIEPVFAAIESQPSAVVYGVAHLITPDDAATFDRLEPGYHRVTVPLHLADGQVVAGYAYLSDAPGVDGIPSARYLGLLIDGAREYGLPGAVIAGWEHLREIARHAATPPAAPGPASLTVAPPGTSGLPADLVAEWEHAPGRPAKPGPQ